MLYGLQIADSGQGLDSDLGFEKSNQTLFKLSRELRFGQGTKAGRDSRYFVIYGSMIGGCKLI